MQMGLGRRGKCVVGLAVVVAAAAAALQLPVAQVFFMRLFRDISRARSHSRLHGRTSALQIVLGDDEELLMPLRPGHRDPSTPWADETGISMTAEELERFNGENGTPLYLAVHGRIYDVSARPTLYGPGRTYHFLVGRDATRALATGCRKRKCMVSSLVGLSEQEKLEALRWVDFFEKHDRYHFIGTVVPDHMADMIQRNLLEDEAKRTTKDILESESFEGQPLLRARALHERGQQINAEGNADLALAVWSLALTLVEPDQAETDAPAAIVPAVAENSELAADIRLERAAALKRQGHTTAARNELQHALKLLGLATNFQAQWLKARALAGQASLAADLNDASFINPFSQAVQLYQSLVRDGASEGDVDTLRRLKTEAVAVLADGIAHLIARQCSGPGCSAVPDEAATAGFQQILRRLCDRDPVATCGRALKKANVRL